MAKNTKTADTRQLVSPVEIAALAGELAQALAPYISGTQEERTRLLQVCRSVLALLDTPISNLTIADQRLREHVIYLNREVMPDITEIVNRFLRK